MRWLPAIPLVLLIALPFFMGGRGDAPPDVPPEDVLRIISPHRRETRLEYAAAFREYMRREHGRDVDVLWLDPGGGTAAILRDLESRYAASPDDPGVDLLFGGGIDPYERGMAKDWFVPVTLPPETLAAIPPDCGGIPVRDPENHWFGVALSSFGVIYNQRILDRRDLTVPVKWEELGQTKLLGWVAGGNPALSGAVHSCYEVVLQAYGWDHGWRVLHATAANTRIFGDSASTAPTEVAAGDAAVGMAIQHYADTAIRASGDPSLGYTLPAGQTIVTPDGIALLKGAGHRELAVTFINFVLSPEGQRILYRPAGVDGQRYSHNRYPVRADAYREPYAPPNNPYRSGAAVRYDKQLGGARWEIVNDLCAAWFIDTHAGLVRAWKAVLARGARPAEAVALFAPPLDGDALRRIVEDDAELGRKIRSLRAPDERSPAEKEHLRALWEAELVDRRLERRRIWSTEALERYRRIANGESGEKP